MQIQLMKKLYSLLFLYIFSGLTYAQNDTISIIKHTDRDIIFLKNLKQFTEEFQISYL
jgi:hypothetical protein